MKFSKVFWANEENRSKYLTKFFDDFYSSVQSQIDYHLAKNRSSTSNDDLSNEILEHAIQCNLLLKRYFPRDDILEQVNSIQ